jgi:hypothetical protein
VAGMETANVDVELLPESLGPSPRSNVAGTRPAAEPSSASSSSTPKLPWVITGVLAAAAGVTGGLALWSSNDLKDKRSEIPGADPDELDRKSTRTKRFALATDLLLGGTIVAAGVATYFTLTAPLRNEVALTVTPGGLALSGAF